MFGFARLARLFCFVLLGGEVTVTKHILFRAFVFLEVLEKKVCRIAFKNEDPALKYFPPAGIQGIWNKYRYCGSKRSSV